MLKYNFFLNISWLNFELQISIEFFWIIKHKRINKVKVSFIKIHVTHLISNSKVLFSLFRSSLIIFFNFNTFSDS